MKTYRVPPITASRCPNEIFAARTRMEEYLSPVRDIQFLLSDITKTLSSVFCFDHLILMNPDSFSPVEQRLHIFPRFHMQDDDIPLDHRRPQYEAVINSESKLIVRTGDSNDRTVIMNRVKDLIHRKFTILFLRNVIESKYISFFGFLSLDQYQYTDQDVSNLFILSDTLTAYWNAIKIKQSTSDDYDFASEPFLSLTELPGVRHVLKLIWKISRQKCPVLLLGETGTGKEIAANTIYQSSVRNNEPFIKVNCANIPDSLIDSELFGHERGAFTGAVDTVKGKFERADKGVLLLDELGELPLTAQTKLLRVIQEGVFERVGGSHDIHVDVRIIAATHRNLQHMVNNGSFRHDLLYRLNIFPIYIPALRERPEDIPVLMKFFLYRACIQYGILDLPLVEEENLLQLLTYKWPGNIRELQNSIDRSVILWDGSKNEKFWITPTIIHDFDYTSSSQVETTDCAERVFDKMNEGTLCLDDMIAKHIRKVLKMTGGKISGKGGAAELLKVNPNTLRAKIKKLKL